MPSLSRWAESQHIYLEHVTWYKRKSANAKALHSFLQAFARKHQHFLILERTVTNSMAQSFVCPVKARLTHLSSTRVAYRPASLCTRRTAVSCRAVTPSSRSSPSADLRAQPSQIEIPGSPQTLLPVRSSVSCRSASNETEPVTQLDQKLLVGEDAGVFNVEKQSATSWALFTGILGVVLAALYVVRCTEHQMA